MRSLDASLATPVRAPLGWVTGAQGVCGHPWGAAGGTGEQSLAGHRGTPSPTVALTLRRLRVLQVGGVGFLGVIAGSAGEGGSAVAGASSPGPLRCATQPGDSSIACPHDQSPPGVPAVGLTAPAADDQDAGEQDQGAPDEDGEQGQEQHVAILGGHLTGHRLCGAAGAEPPGETRPSPKAASRGAGQPPPAPRLMPSAAPQRRSRSPAAPGPAAGSGDLPSPRQPQPGGQSCQQPPHRAEEGTGPQSCPGVGVAADTP